jgi:hypothetical protein
MVAFLGMIPAIAITNHWWEFLVNPAERRWVCGAAQKCSRIRTSGSLYRKQYSGANNTAGSLVKLNESF